MENLENKVLLRQLKKSKIKSFTDINEETFSKFISLVEETYSGMDESVYRLERALDISTKELQDLNDNLEKKILEEVEKNIEKDKQLLSQSRSASMGEMIGNIAHQWRQPLSAISSTCSSLLLQKQLGLASDDDIKNSYNKILEYTDFLTQTIEDFRDFFKQDKELEEFLISEYLQKTLSIIESSYKNSNIKIVEHKIEDETLTNGFPNELTQVFLNIFNNAKDILVDKEESHKEVHIYYSQSDDYNIVSILDNGGGVPNNIKDEIFDPYFTTKHKAQGTGIGLYMCKQIVEKHNKGKILLENRKIDIEGISYEGACFNIYLLKAI